MRNNLSRLRSLTRAPAISTVALFGALLLSFVKAAVAAEAPAAPPPFNGPWSAATNGLQSRIVLNGSEFKQGEPIIPKVFVRNVSDKPVRYDRHRIDTHPHSPQAFTVIGADGHSAPDTSAGVQYMEGAGKYDYPILEPGQEIEIDSARLDTPDYYMGKPGTYQIAWRGTWVGAPMVVDVDEWNRTIREAQKIAVGLPATGPVEIRVVAAPAGEHHGDLAGRIFPILPAGWRINGTSILADDVRPPGRRGGLGSILHLQHNPAPGYIAGQHATIDLFVMKQPADEDPNALTNGLVAAECLGKGPLGYVYWAPRNYPRNYTNYSVEPVTRWNHAIYDISTALEVRDPKPVKPNGPDWGRMACQIMLDCFEEYHAAPQDRGAMFYLCTRVKITTGRDGKPLLHYDSSAVDPNASRAAFNNRKADQKSCLFSFSVQPLGTQAPLDPSDANREIHWDGVSPSRRYQMKRLGVEVIIETRSEDEEIARRLNLIVDRALTSLLAASI